MTMTTPGSLALSRTPHPGSGAIALTLARAFLSAEEWSRDPLFVAGTSVLGARRRWLGPVVGDVLRRYHRPPVGAARELAAVVELSVPFQAALERAAKAGRPIQLARYLPEEQPSEAPGGLDNLVALGRLLHLTAGELDWFADSRHWNGRARSERLRHYRYEWLARPGRTPRLLQVPRPRLRDVQRTLLREVFGGLNARGVTVHSAAHGFVSGRSALSAANRHVGSAVVVNLDLTSFFTRVRAGQVYGMLRRAGFPEPVAHALTGLCTHSVPASVVSAAPPGGTVGERFALRQVLALPHLPQGAPSSPALANLAVRQLDVRLAGWAEAAGAVYTRYADDLTFSGGDQLAHRADAFVRGVTRIVEHEGHTVNPIKTRVRGASVRQMVTGVVVNERTNVGRAEYDRLKAILHNCSRFGPQSQNRVGHHDFRAHLLGRVAWMEQLNPVRGQKLREMFNRIQW